MKLTTKTRNSLRILVQLASSYKKGPIKGKDISSKQNISEPYLEQIMITLKSVGFVRTVRGCNGGYVLNRPSENISVLDVLEVFEGKIELAGRLENPLDNNLFSQCPTTSIWKHLSNTLKSEAKEITLQIIVDKMNESNIQEYVI
jgi:Rrf2 family transcriptional regulator, cysteine metabolism repressor